MLTNTVPTNTVPTNTVPTNTVPTNTVPTNTVPTNTVPTDAVLAADVVTEHRRPITLPGGAARPLRDALGLPWRAANRCERPARIGWGVGGLLMLALALALAIGGCGARNAVTLPHKATAPAGSPVAAAGPPSVRDQVVAAYTGYWQALGQALDTRNAARARAILARYAAPANIPSLISGFETDWERSEIQHGMPVPHILSVEVAGDHAEVHDCADFSGVGVQSAATGQVIGSLGDPRVNMISTLALSHGQWLITDQVPVVMSCVP